jgi:hypothetical protein
MMKSKMTWRDFKRSLCYRCQYCKGFDEVKGLARCSERGGATLKFLCDDFELRDELKPKTQQVG